VGDCQEEVGLVPRIPKETPLQRIVC
jgi:hypothetical protein